MVRTGPLSAMATGAGIGGASGADDDGAASLEDHERLLIVKVLQDTGWNQSAKARTLGITRDILRYRIRKYGLRPADGESGV